jgi:hypothetical protein
MGRIEAARRRRPQAVRSRREENGGDGKRGDGKRVRSQFESSSPQTLLFPCWGRRRDKLTTSPPVAFRWRMWGRWGVERGEWGVACGEPVEPGVRRRRGWRLSLLSSSSFKMIGTTTASAQRRAATTRSDGERSAAVAGVVGDLQNAINSRHPWPRPSVGHRLAKNGSEGIRGDILDLSH